MLENLLLAIITIRYFFRSFNNIKITGGTTTVNNYVSVRAEAPITKVSIILLLFIYSLFIYIFKFNIFFF